MSEFLAVMPAQLPDLLDRKTMDPPAVYDDYAQLTYHPVKRLTVSQVSDMFEEQANLRLLYHRVASDGLVGWQVCCAFSNPGYRRMYKLNAEADANGVVRTVTAYIFESIDVMRSTLRLELAEHRKAGGMVYQIDDAELIRMFF